MKLAAADALARLVAGSLRDDYVIPSVFDERVGPTVAEAVARAT
jgi:malate dehydrogenase (oxaloacetate-decarboxylating)